MRVIIQHVFFALLGFAFATAPGVAASAPEVGRPFVRAYAPAESGATDDVRCVVQDARGVMLFGTRGAVLEFDGETWRRIAVPTAGFVHRLAALPDKTVWLVADGELGRLVLQGDGSWNYESLVAHVPGGRTTKIDATVQLGVAGRQPWCTTPGALLRWTGSAFAAQAVPGDRAFELFDGGAQGLIAYGPQAGTWLLREDAALPLPQAPRETRPLAWLSLLPAAAGWLLATEGGPLELVRPDGSRADVGARLNRIVSGVALGAGGYAFAQARGGIDVLDASLRLRYSAASSEGVGVEGVRAFGRDRAGGLWVVASRDIARIEHSMPAVIFDGQTGYQERGTEIARPPENEILTGADAGVDVYRADGRLLVQLGVGSVRFYDEERRRFALVGTLRESRASWSTPGGVLFNSAGGARLLVRGAANNRQRQLSNTGTVRGAPATIDDAHFIFATEVDFRLVWQEGDNWQFSRFPHALPAPITSAWPESPRIWWVRSGDAIMRLRLEGETIAGSDVFGGREALNAANVLKFVACGGEWLALTTEGIRRFDATTRRFEAFAPSGRELTAAAEVAEEVVLDPAGRFWLLVHAAGGERDSARVVCVEPGGRRRELPRDLALRLRSPLRLRVDTEPADGPVLWILAPEALGRIDLAHWAAATAPQTFPVNLRGARMVGGDRLALAAADAPLPQSVRTLRFSFAAAHFPLSGRVEYQTKLDGLDEAWTDWQPAAVREFTNLPVGRFTFRVRARHEEATGEAEAFSFVIVPPWWRTPAAIAGWAVLAVSGTFGLVRWRVRQLRRHNDELGLQVAARTAELVANQEQLRLARDAAEAANRAKSAFLAHMSHELRTPLNGILGYAQVLRRDPAQTAAARTRLGVIVDSGEHLLALINEVLDLAKVEAGKMELRTTDVSLVRLAQAVGDLVRARCEERALAFEVQVAPGLPRLVRTDEQKLRQVLLNLLGNAIKFTAQGRVTLAITPTIDGRVRFAIEDTGAGIAPERLTKLFTAFDAAAGKNAPGTGLGLALSQRMIELLGGRIQVSSTPGAGSRFWFDLPLPEVASSTPFDGAPRAQAITGYEGPRLRVLVVDDDATNRAVLRDLLEPLGFGIDEAANAAETLALARANAPQAVLLDLRFDEGPDGLAIARQLRADAALAATRIVAVSASVFETDRHEALAAGCDAFLAKPFKEEQLLATLGGVLGLRWIHAGTAGEIAAATPAEPLPENVRVVLLELARRGDAVRLRARLAELAQMPAHATLARQLDEHAASFQMKRIREILDHAQDHPDR